MPACGAIRACCLPVCCPAAAPPCQCVLRLAPASPAGVADSPRILLVSLKAGGVGLNLTAATRVHLLDPWWNPSVEEQAMDRVHRLGQTQPVHIFR